MAAAAGRALRIKYDADGAGGTGAAVIAGAKTDSLTINNTSIDITDKDDSGIVTMLDDIGTQQLSLSVDGVAFNSTLGDLAAASASGTALNYFEIVIAGLKTYAGNFFIDSFEYSGAEGDEALTFSCSLSSSGAIVIT